MAVERGVGGGCPDLLTVEEAAAVLRIGRTSAYELARQWLATNGADGLPVQRIGGLLRVSRYRLEELIGGPVTWPPPVPARKQRAEPAVVTAITAAPAATPSAVSAASGPTRRPRRTAAATAQSHLPFGA